MGWACACKGKPGAAKGRVVLAGGLAAERGFEQLGGGGGVYGHHVELLATCGNAGDVSVTATLLLAAGGSHGRGI